MDQWVSTPVANQKAAATSLKNGNAAAGVEARNGAGKVISGGKIGRKDKVQPPALARHIVALIDREGRVIGTFACRDAARSFLQGGWA